MIYQLIDKIIIFIFSWHLKSWDFNVVKVKGWGCFLVEGKGIMRKTVQFQLLRGILQ